MRHRVEVSVLVRSFNNAATISAALSSALAQNYPRQNYEIIAVDDGSTDGTRELLRSFAPGVRVSLERHRGNVETAHTALAMARGKYFALLDADDTYEPDFLSEMTRALEGRPDAAFAYCDYYETRPNGTSTVTIDDKIIKLIACNCMFDREIVVREGFWQNDLLLPELSLAIELSRRYGVAYVQKPLYHYFRHDASLTHQRGFVDKAFAQLAKKYRILLRGRELDQLSIDECSAAIDCTE